MLDQMLEDRPDVRRGAMFGLPGFFTGKKMFVCSFNREIGLKLPVGRVAELRDADEAMQPHARRGRLMKEWVYIVRNDAEDLHGDFDLLEESITFVGANA